MVPLSLKIVIPLPLLKSLLEYKLMKHVKVISLSLMATLGISILSLPFSEKLSQASDFPLFSKLPDKKVIEGKPMIDQFNKQQAKGTIKGKLYYPSEYIPAMTVCAQSVHNYYLMNCTPTKEDQESYTLTVNPGEYFVFGHVNGEGREGSIYHAGSSPESRPKVVKVLPSRSTQNIDIDNWFVCRKDAIPSYCIIPPAPRIGSLPNGIYVYCDLPETSPREMQAMCFAFRKTESRIVGNYYPDRSSFADICIEGTSDGNTVSGFAVESVEGVSPAEHLRASQGNTLVNWSEKGHLKVAKKRVILETSNTHPTTGWVRFGNAVLSLNGFSPWSYTPRVPNRCTVD